MVLVSITLENNRKVKSTNKKNKKNKIILRYI